MPEGIAAAFDEVERRDADRACRRVALVDGNRHQIQVIEAEAAARAWPSISCSM